jgi:GNAT superfamily N-acetyltransferase
LTIFFDRGALLRQQAIQRARQWGKSAAKAAGITPERLRAAARFSKRLSKVTASPRSALPTLFHLMKRRLWETQEIRLYRIPASRIDRQYQQDAIRCNCVMDLLCYQPAERWQPSKRAFLSMVMSRFEEGLRVYTHAQEGRLVHYGWLTLSAAKSFLPEVQATYEYPQGSAVLWDFYTDPAHRGKGLYSRSLRQMLRDAAAAEGTEFAYIAVLADNTASRKVIEKAGFEHQASIMLRRRLHRVSHTRHSTGG